MGLVADLVRRNEELAAVAAHWQARAGVLEGRLLALGAGEDAPTRAPDAPGAAEPPRPASEALMLRWRRWLRRMTDG